MDYTELLQTLKDIRDALNPDDADSFRCDDPEGAMDYAHQKALTVIKKAEG
jgi:hypothetical protein